MLSTGQIFGKYRIESVLGQSRITTVYKAMHTELDRIVAIKVFAPEISSNNQILNILYGNSQLASQIYHPNVAQVYDVGLIHQDFYVVMQLISGNTLSQILEQVGMVTQADALYLTKQIALALDAIHEKQLLHRDIKPGNIFVTDEEEIKLVDMGLATLIPGTSLLGNTFYVAPEVISSGNVDNRADLYSLGATLFHILTGVPPYHEGDIPNILQQHLSAPVPLLKKYNASIDESVDQLMSLLLAKRPENRIANAKELVKILEKLVLETSTPSSSQHSSDIPKDVEKFLLNKIAQSPEDRMYIQDMLEAIANSESKPNIPEEARDLMNQIITQEFSERFACPPDIIGKIKKCHHILENPKIWIQQQLANIPSKTLPVVPPPLAPKTTELPVVKPLPAKEPGTASTSQDPPTTVGRAREYPTSSGIPTASGQEEAPPSSFKGRSYQTGSSQEPKSNIIKSSQRVNEVLLSAKTTPRSPKPPSDMPVYGKPTHHKSPILDPSLQKSIEEQDGKKVQAVTTEDSGGRKFLKFIFLLLILCGLGGLGYIAYRVPEIRIVIQQQLAKYGLIEPPKIESPVEIREDPAKKYADPIVQITRELTQKAFSQSRRNLGKLKAKADFTESLYLEVLKQIEEAEKKEIQTFPQGVGWFGEPLPAGLKRLPTQGEYLWEKDETCMVFVAKGSFYRGEDGQGDASPSAKIYISGFYIDKYEVTNKQYNQFLKETGYNREPNFCKDARFNQPNQPVVGISWDDAGKYAQWAQKRLPTEAEWEKAATGGVSLPDWQSKTAKINFKQVTSPKRKFPWGDNLPLPNMANYKQVTGDDAYPYPAPVGEFPSGTSPYLCEDMAGNVMEWCFDTYKKDYYNTKESRNHNPKYIDTNSKERVCRGGSWEDFPAALYCFQRYAYLQDTHLQTVGMRTVLPAKEK